MDSESEEAASGSKRDQSGHDLNSHLYSLKSNSDIANDVASKYLSKRPETDRPRVPRKSFNYSSDDSDSEYSTLVGLGAKLMNSKPSSFGGKEISFPLKTGGDFSNSSSESEDSSLIGLMRKNRVEETKEGCLNKKHKVKDEIDGYINFENRQSSQFACLKEPFNKLIKSEFKGVIDYGEAHVGIRQEDCSGSADDVHMSKPGVKELQNIANYHRQHTKSESDRFNPVAASSLDNILKKNLDHLSSSLRNLRGSGFNDIEFKFSPGGSIPGSFKSLNPSSVNSSQTSLGFDREKVLHSNTDIYSAYSDSDMSVDCQFFKDETKVKPSRQIVPTDAEDGGINLAGALKISASPRVSESLVSENDEITSDAEEEEFVTLLDKLNVDETIDEENEKKCVFSNSENEESCIIDISHVLNVKIELRTNTSSSFGKVVCRRWKSLRTLPYCPKDKFETSVVPFDFKEPSPDDLIANAFKRRL